MTRIAHTPPAPEIFKAYDIRGIVDVSLTEPAVRAIGHALGSEARAREQSSIAVGRDGRLSGPALASALAEGIRAAGVDVIDIGAAPTPVTYFAAHHLGIHSCVSVTGSHNPPDYNGLKMVLGGETLFGEQIRDLRRRIADNDLCYGKGELSHADVTDAYTRRIISDIRLARPMKVVVDCGNGIAGAVAPHVLEGLGCELVELFCEVDGTFPNHHPDPSKPENLQDVVHALRNSDAELGLAFDGDGDRLGVVTRDGEIIYPDRQMMLFAADVLERVPGGEIIYDVKCTRLLDSWIREHGGRPTMWNTGHALIKRKLAETGAPLAGEMSGHVFFKERWFGFDDGIYAAARLLEILSRHEDSCAVLQALPNAINTPELNIRMNEGEPFALVERLRHSEHFHDASRIVDLDGIRVEYADGFGLVRASNTTPVAVLRFEADDKSGLARIQSAFRDALRDAWPGIDLPF
jgi:phosphomannomutase/phosphoglucomutase